MRIVANVVTAGVVPVTLALVAAPACAEVTQKTESGFVVRVTAEVAASPADAWKAFTTPSLWWSAQHTFSGDSANLALDPVANGCFCEKLPVPKDALAGQKPGSVMHMRVVYAEPYRALRMVGGLGPLQSEAVNGTMTVTFKPVDGSGGKATRILWEYVVGGFMRYKTEIISGAVDKVLEGQLAGLVKVLGPVKPVDSEPEQTPAPSSAAEPLVAEPLATDAAIANDEPSYTPDPTRDEEEAGRSVKSALDKLFPKKASPLPDGR